MSKLKVNSRLISGAPMMPDDRTVPKLLTVEEAARLLSVKPVTIRSWILRRKKLEVVKVGRCVRITERSIMALIDENTIPPKR